LCGVHCINTLLQGPFMTEWDLAKIAQELDAMERNLMASQGVDTKDFLKYAAEESGNVAGDGMFSIQVRICPQSCTKKSRCSAK
jgi:Ataxin-3